MNFSAARCGKASGTFDSDSAPPASTISASPRRIASAPLVMARLAEAQARFTVVPGIDAGSAARKTISRPRFGAWSAATTTPKTHRSISAGSIAARATTSAAAIPARSMTSSSFKSLPARANGVRQASTTATRPAGPRNCCRETRSTPGATPGDADRRVQTESARSRTSVAAEASFGAGSGAGGWPRSGDVSDIDASSLRRVIPKWRRETPRRAAEIAATAPASAARPARAPPRAASPSTSSRRNRSLRCRNQRRRKKRGARDSSWAASSRSSSTLPETIVGRAQAKSSGWRQAPGSTRITAPATSAHCARANSAG